MWSECRLISDSGSYIITLVHHYISLTILTHKYNGWYRRGRWEVRWALPKILQWWPLIPPWTVPCFTFSQNTQRAPATHKHQQLAYY